MCEWLGDAPPSLEGNVCLPLTDCEPHPPYQIVALHYSIVGIEGLRVVSLDSLWNECG